MSLAQPTLKDTLDLIITRGDENLVHDIIILPDLFSDHKVVTCKLIAQSRLPLKFMLHTDQRSL